MAVAPKKKTLAQLQAEQAAKIAALAVDPAKTQINSEIAAAEAQRIARLKASEGVTKAVAAMSAGDAEAARAAYAGQAERLAAYGSGLTGNLRTLQDNAAAEANALASRLGVGTQTASLGAPSANVAHQLNVVIPGEGIAAQAPRALLNAQAHRNALGARLADNASLEDFKAGQTVEGIRAKLAEIEAKRPGLILEALDHIRSQANAERATNTQIGYLQLQQAKTVQDRAVAMTNLTGTLHVVVGKGPKAKVVDTGKPALGSDAGVAQTRAATSEANAAAAAAAKVTAANIAAENRRGNAIIAANAKVAAAQIAATKKTVSAAKSGVDAQTKFVTEGRKYVRQIAGVNEKLGRPMQRPPKRVALMSALEKTYGAALVGKFGITKADVHNWAHAIVMALPNTWWDPRTYSSGGGSTGTVTVGG